MNFNRPEEIYLIHHGNQDYLQIAARESKKSENAIILIGNSIDVGRICDHYYDEALIPLPDYEIFKSHYVHMSSAPEEFELLCFKRYFYLYAIAKQRGHTHFWMMDSDAIILQNLSAFTYQFLVPSGFSAGVSTRHQSELDWASSPHTSYWTLAGLEDFISFLKNLYTSEYRQHINRKYDWHLANNISGGICDMTALFLWQKNRGDVYNLAQAHLEGFPLFDNNLNEGGNMMEKEFEMVGNVKLKKIEHQNGLFKAFLSASSRPIPVASLHFQGRAKSCMSTFEKRKHITYWTYAFFSVLVYFEKRRKSFIRKLKYISQ